MCAFSMHYGVLSLYISMMLTGSTRNASDKIAETFWEMLNSSFHTQTNL